MHRSKAPYILFLAALLLFNGLIFLTPILAMQAGSSTGVLYAAFSPTCHQLTERSFCVFKSKSNGGLSIGDCLPAPEFSPSHA